jgi:hypothetical protein
MALVTIMFSYHLDDGIRIALDERTSVRQHIGLILLALRFEDIEGLHSATH